MTNPVKKIVGLILIILGLPLTGYGVIMMFGCIFYGGMGMTAPNEPINSEYTFFILKHGMVGLLGIGVILFGLWVMLSKKR